MTNSAHVINKFPIVKQIPIFSNLNWIELHTIASKCTLAEYKKGDIICKEGTPPDALYCLVSGRLQAYKTKPNGEREGVELILRGMHFGIISLLTGEQHSLTFEAINDSTIIKISKDDFQDILKNIPRLGVEFSRSLSRRIRSQVVRSKSVFESMIVSIYSPVKGSGSSTYAVNLALSLSRETKKKVIFISIFSSATTMLAPPSPRSNEASPQWKKSAVNLRDIIGKHEKIMQSIMPAETSLHLLHVAINPLDHATVKQISQFVSALANDFHFIVVDLPNDMDDVVLETLTQSDLVQLITVDREEDLLLTRHVIDRLKGTSRFNFVKEKVQVVVSGLMPKCYLSFEELNKSLNYQVSYMLPFINPSELSRPYVSEHMSVITPHALSEYSKTVTQFARKVGGVLVGLVLGGGAALGLAHIGVIRVLEREKIPIDVVVGSSMGALIGSLWAVGNNADGIEAIAREFEKKKAMSKLLDLVFPKSAIIGGKAIERWLRRHIGSKTFFGTRFLFKVVAYDLIHREELVISDGSIVDAVRKSIAIPGVITPILQKDKMIIDGGVLNPLPVNVLTGLGIKKIIAINVLQSPADVAKGFEIIQQRLAEEAKIPFLKSPWQYLGLRLQKIINKIINPNISDIIVRSLQATEYILAEQSAVGADIVLHPDLAGVNWFELYQVGRIIRAGEEIALRHLIEIKKLTTE